jgi:hypothetical protein
MSTLGISAPFANKFQQTSSTTFSVGTEIGTRPPKFADVLQVFADCLIG